MTTISLGRPDSVVDAGARKHAHTVQFYTDDALLVEWLGGQIVEVLNRGGAALVIATEEHSSRLADRLSADQISNAMHGRLINFDARKCLDTFMVDEWPNERLFLEQVGGSVQRLCAGREPGAVVAFGEMVAILWQQGLRQAALQLERLWNELLQKNPFTLHCAYPMKAFESPEDFRALQEICKQHVSIISPALPPNRSIQAVEAERALRQSEQRFRLLVEGVQDYAIFMLDREGCISSWNEGARRIKGYQASDIIGRHFSCFYPDEDIRSGKPQMELVVASQTGRFEDEGWRLRQDGSRFWANVIITALKDPDGTLLGFSKVTRDITERMHAQEAVEANRDALKKKVEERMAAELRLQESEHSLRLLSRSLFHIQDEERRHLGRELHDTIGQYLSALKMELDSIQFGPGLQDIARQHLQASVGLVEQCVKEVRTMSYLLYPPLLEEMGLRVAIPWYIDGFAKRSGIKTELQMSSSFGRLPANLELVLFRVLQEALTNVHRHSGSPTALIRLFVENELAVLEITDAGKGLPTAAFKFGEQEIKNMGIGLQGMSERVKSAGGKLELSSSGNGTTVRVSVASSAPPATETTTIYGDADGSQNPNR